MRKAWSSFAAISLLLSPAAHAATFLERTVHVAIRDDDSLLETRRLRVRIDDADDVGRWSTYSVAVDDNRTLEELDVEVVLPGGRTITLGDDDQDVVEPSRSAVFYSSQRFHQARLRELVPGAVVRVRETVVSRPAFRAGKVRLRGGDPIERLEISVEDRRSAAGEGWRWRLEEAPAGLTIEESDRGVVVRANGLAPARGAPLGPSGGDVLRFGWGADGTWDGVGAWYGELLAGVPRDDALIRSAAEAVTAGLEAPRRRLDALAGFVQRKVRYVAVVVGTGTYVPSPPADVYRRKWGDCKDKSLLLVDLLRSVGIEAYPTLLAAGRERRLDPLFPSHEQFTHAIVAVPADAVKPGPEDAVAGGYLFVDPTQSAGAGRWLHPQAQDQHALVVRPGRSELVRTPLVAWLERRRLTVDLVVEPGGDARGRAELELRGETAYRLAAAIDGLDPGRAAEEARALFARLLPGAELDGVAWSLGEGDVPALDLSAAVVLPGLVQGGEGSRSLWLPGLRATPDPRLLRERRDPVALPAGVASTRWSLSLPGGWCPPPASLAEVDNAAGALRHAVTADGSGRLVVESRVEIRRRWIEGAALRALYELAVAEHRAHRRRTRLKCEISETPGERTPSRDVSLGLFRGGPTQ